MSKIVLCLSTVAKRQDADRIAKHLVSKRFVACVNIVPGLVSHYRWKGKVCREVEFLLMMKTTAAKAGKLEKEIAKIHPYELPEFVILSLKGGSRRYLDWITQNI